MNNKLFISMAAVLMGTATINAQTVTPPYLN